MKKIVLLMVSLLAFTSCENYLDEPNANYSNNPLATSLTPKQRMAAAQMGLLNTEVFSWNTFGNKMTYAHGLNGGWTSSDAAYTFAFNTSSYSHLWNNHFLYIANFDEIIKLGENFPTYQNHIAIAKIMKAQGMEKIINMYGDAPFTEAFDKNNLYPRYDDDKQIVQDLVNLLDEARDEIVAAANPSSGAETVGAEDVMFGGNMLNWYAYANTLKLRMLLRLSNVTDTDLVTFRDNKFAAIQNGFISADVTFNPGFTGATAAQSNPMFRLYGTNTAINAWNQSYRSTCAGQFIAEILNGNYTSTNLQATVDDPRKNRMFRGYNGSTYGTTTGDILGSEHNNQPSSPVAYSILSRYVNGFLSTVSGTDAYNNGSGRDGYVMLAAESYFLQAEAIQRGYMTGNAQAMFTQGIYASFAFHEKGWGTLPATIPLAQTAGDYITATDGLQGLGWTGSTDKINAIMTQKWLALANWSGIEPYFDFLRTGYPEVPLPYNSPQSTYPKRLIYPTSEYSNNSANVPSVVLSDLFTVNTTTPYYLQ